MSDLTTVGADDCLTCNGKGWVTVQAEPRIVETCPTCLADLKTEIEFFRLH